MKLIERVIYSFFRCFTSRVGIKLIDQFNHFFGDLILGIIGMMLIVARGSQNCKPGPFEQKFNFIEVAFGIRQGMACCGL